MAEALDQDLDILVSENVNSLRNVSLRYDFVGHWCELIDHYLDCEVVVTIECPLGVDIFHVEGPIGEEDDLVLEA